MSTEIDIEKLASDAGINTKFWNMGAGSVLFVSFVDGIPRSNFEDFCKAFQCEVLEQASITADAEAEKWYSKWKDSEDWKQPYASNRIRWVGWHVRDAIRAMKPTPTAPQSG